MADQAKPPADADEYPASDEEGTDDPQLDLLRVAALRLARILLDPGVSNALQRNETRQQAWQALTKCIDALALMCETARLYGDAMAQASAVDDSLRGRVPAPGAASQTLGSERPPAPPEKKS